GTTVKTWFFVPAARFRVRVLQFGGPFRTEGAGNAGCTTHPLPRVQRKRTHAGSTQVRRNHPALPAQWVYGCSVLSSANRHLPPSPVSCLADLSPALAGQDHTACTAPSTPHARPPAA